jgi:two-component system, NarL family, sensor histidine kinase YdfH
MLKSMLTKEPVRWFLLLWIAMAVVRVLLDSNKQGHSPGGRSPNGAPTFIDGTPPLAWILIFLLLAALFSFLLWRGLSARVQPRLYWRYFLLQGLLVAVMQWWMEEHALALQFHVLNFYMVLTLCALAMFKRAAPALLVGTYCLVLFVVLLSINLPQGLPPVRYLAAWLDLWRSFSDPTTIVFFVLGYLMLYMQQSQSQRQLEQTHRELQGAYSRLAASARQIETLTLLTERQRIARELHDTLAQGIAGMIMQLEVTSAQLRRKHYLQAHEVLSQALAHARTTLHDARQAITELRSRTPRVDQLLSSVQHEITHFSQQTGIAHHTNLNDLMHTPAHACDHVLRFIGEGLNNVARHAHAHQVRVEAKIVEQRLVITVQDDGQGFDPTNQTLYTGHYGLLGLQERAHLVAGTLSVTSAEGKGTTLEFRVALAAADNPAFSGNLAPFPPVSVEDHTHV